MEFNRLVAVTGLPGLFEVLSSKADGAIVRSLEDQSTRFVSSRVHNLSHLESIEIYTVRDNVSLSDLFSAMSTHTEALPDVKDNKALKAYFEKVFPELDFDRVYASDMKKMVKWFMLLKSNNVPFDKPAEAEPAVVAEVATEQKAEEPAAPEEVAKPKRTRKKKTEEQ
jgi:hypothetical protein